MTSQDHVLNYSYGLLLPLTFIISLLLNPLIFLYNFRKRPSVASLLFQSLTISDFITCLYQPILLLRALWEPGVPAIEGKPTAIQIISTVVMTTVIFGSGMLTHLLSITRYIKIRHPFVNIKRRYVFVYLLLNFVTFEAGLLTLLLTSRSTHFDIRIQVELSS